MKAVAYSIKPFEKEHLAKANHKKHDITLISNPLNLDTVAYAKGKYAVIVTAEDDVFSPVIEKLAAMGVRFIVTRTLNTAHIDKETASRLGIKISNVPIFISENEKDIDELQRAAYQTIKNLDLWQQNKCVGDACACANSCRTNLNNTK
ncbi:D-isomer specific 2-hydroxyacid dehydrogenase-like protein [Mucilaginibacter gracilis]|uniref:D-isomer specific 2-hydroxyacid dehydrogenase-like protein n=1 Tax=Mucilaginibacter gracilis TaxID=423350 RepID=A0A495J3K7_9SPHI|nr:lactate dehydrogenase [Mucilaginibacter gracilis]RKR83566.1 D-isomer specific 2-hydroxyacid dehydrogenase-like protein [Mucilaginibacter gracilis]